MEKYAIQHPDEMNHPWHPNHPLWLLKNAADVICLSCGKLMKVKEEDMCYGCSICGDFSLHLDCAVRNPSPPQPLLVDRPKTHEHTLTLFPREVSFTCNACGIKGNVSPYVCLSCRFMIHKDCINLPRVIRINRHPHRLSHSFSIATEKNFFIFGQNVKISDKNLVCGVCREGVDGRYGAYSCLLCSNFYVHSRCATRKDVWDGKELEDEPEEESLQDPFNVISEDTIKHFSHEDHELRRITDDNDDNARCYACNLQLSPHPFYKCFKCDFFLHETCANRPVETRSPIHQHKLRLLYKDANLFRCDACDHNSNGFRYSCSNPGCDIDFDTKCVSITDDPFIYGGHNHPLHLLSPDEDGPCSACDQNTSQRMMLGCVECKFCLCFACATLPSKIPYEDDPHSLSLHHGEISSCKNYWCDSCERKVDPHKSFYECSSCGTTVHTKCAIGGGFRNLTLGVNSSVCGSKFIMVPNDQVTGPRCSLCECRKGPLMFKSRAVNGDLTDSYTCSECFEISEKDAQTVS